MCLNIRGYFVVNKTIYIIRLDRTICISLKQLGVSAINSGAFLH